MGGGSGTQYCWPSDSWTQYYSNPIWYTPRPGATWQFHIPVAEKTLNVRVVVWHRTAEDPNNYTNTVANENSIRATLEEVSDLLAFSAPPSDPSVIPDYNYFSPTRLRLEVKGVHFLVNETLWNSEVNSGDAEAYMEALNAAAHAAIPGSEACLLLHVVKPGSNGLTLTVVENNFDITRSIYSHAHSQSPDFATDADWYDGHWSHELGHVMGLLHTYDSGYNEPCAGPNYLADVFSIPTNTWCDPANGGPGFPANCSICFFPGAQPISPFAAQGDGYHNNLMGNNDDNGFISPLQMARMHRTLMTTSNAQFAVGYTDEPLVVWGAQIWDWRMKIYSDVVIPAGVTLTIKCEIHMVPEARIIVEAGGRLIIDGGKVTVAKHATQRWMGVQVRGATNSSQVSTIEPPYPDQQGYVELKNGGSIEHAEQGVDLGSSLSPVGGGGVIVVDGTPSEVAGSFINCRNALSFAPYIFGELNNEPNAAILRFVHFERNNDYLPESNAAPDQTPGFVEVNQAPGITLRGCTFANNQQGITESHLLAQGIRTYNSRISILPGCPVGNTCPHAQEVPTTFSNLDHAVEARSSGGDHYLTIRKANFINNIAGVYTSGLTGLSITQCDFVLGNNPVALTHPDEDPFWDDFHRGIYAHESYAFNIRSNTLSADPLGPGGNTEGIVIGYSRDHNDVVSSNAASNLTRAYVGEGICAEVFNGQSRSIGLQFRCNTNQNNAINIWSRKVEEADEEQQDIHTIRTNQGSKSLTADNRFDNWPVGDPQTWDLHVTTTFLHIRYHYRTNPLSFDLIPSSYGPELTLLTGYPIASPYCKRHLASVPNLTNTGDLKQFLLSERLAYGNTRYIFDALLDGGSTDEVVQEISSTWPNEAWQLRTYLLGLSPHLSVDALKAAVNKAYFPMAMKAEVCIANPDATQDKDLIKFLEEEADEPMPTYLIDLIRASWNTETYRTELELDMGDRHTAMTQAANELLLLYHEAGGNPGAQRWAWQQIRTTAARYAEAQLLLGQSNYGEALAVVDSIQLDQSDLKSVQIQEQQRMSSYIQLLQDANALGRSYDQLDSGEVAHLEGLIADAYDRPANWISNLLCMSYHKCRAPLTGGKLGDPKSRFLDVGTTDVAPKNIFRTAPNPANSWVTFTYTFRAAPKNAYINVQDAVGKEVAQLTMPNEQGQLVLDTRQLGSGVYTVRYSNAGAVEQVDKLIVQ